MGIFWCLGRYVRARSPERPVLGEARYWSSEHAAREVKVKQLIEMYRPNRVDTAGGRLALENPAG